MELARGWEKGRRTRQQWLCRRDAGDKGDEYLRGGRGRRTDMGTAEGEEDAGDREMHRIAEVHALEQWMGLWGQSGKEP